MKPVIIQNLVKTYGTHRVLDNVSLEIQAGELFFLLGPSGCGKTTLLRSIAGFVEPDSGTIRIGDRDVSRVPPRHRHTGMVFQSYALWPHLTIRENVAFGLRVEGRPKAEILERTTEALELVRMLGHADKKPNQLSGGQQQRVALARALVIRPECLLLDEPLSNLDAKLRAEMRTEIRRICKQSGLTGIYVTHDQKEALSVADQIAVMRNGVVEEIGTPTGLYHRPSSRFTADFIGQANFLPARATRHEDGRIVFDSALGIFHAAHIPPFAREEGAAVTLGIRPEAITRFTHEPLANTFRGAIESLTYLGETTQYTLAVAGTQARSDEARVDCLELSRGPNILHEKEIVDWWVDDQNVMVLPAGGE